MKNEFKMVGTDFRTGTIACYGPDDKTVTKIVVGRSKIKLCQISSKVRLRSFATDRRRCFMDCFRELLML